MKKQYACIFKLNLREGYELDRTFSITDMVVQDFEESEVYKDSIYCDYWSESEYQVKFKQMKNTEENEQKKMRKNGAKTKPRMKKRVTSASSRGSRNKPKRQLECPKFSELQIIRKMGYEVTEDEDLLNFRQKYIDTSSINTSRNNSIFEKKNNDFLSPKDNLKTENSSLLVREKSFNFRQRSIMDEPSGMTASNLLNQPSENLEKEGTSNLSSPNSSFDEGNLNNTLKKILVLTDSKGFIKTIILDPLMAYYKIQKFNRKHYNLKRYRKYKMNLSRKDNIIAEKSAENFFYICKKMLSRYQPPLILADALLRKKWRGHRGSIVSMNTMNDLEGFLTCGKDKFVKVWGLTGQNYAKVSLTDFDRKVWNFPFNWISVIIDELNAVFDVIAKLEGRALLGKARDELIANYFYRNFIFRDLKRRYEVSDQFMIKKVNRSDVNRELYLKRVRE